MALVPSCGPSTGQYTCSRKRALGMMLLASTTVTPSGRATGRAGASIPGGWTLRLSASSGSLLVMARSISRLATAQASAVDVSAAAGCEKSTSASCRAAGVLRRHCAPTRCDRSTLRTCGADERSKLDRPRPGPSPPHPSAGLGCPGPHGGARGGRSNDVPKHLPEFFHSFLLLNNTTSSIGSVCA